MSKPMNLRASALERFSRRVRRQLATRAQAHVSFWLCALLLGGVGYLAMIGKTAAQNSDAAMPASVPGPTPSPELSPATVLPSRANDSSDTQAAPDATPANEGTGNLFDDSSAQESTGSKPKRPGEVTVTELDIQRSQADVDQLSSLTFQRAQTNAESLFQSVGGVPLPLNPLLFNSGSNKETGFIVGPFTIRPVLSTGVSYRTISGDRDNTSSGFYGYVAPTALITLGEPATGRTISVQYGGNVSFGSDAGSNRAYNQSLSASGIWNFTKLNLGFGVDFSQLSGSDRDFGGEDVNREIVGLTLNGSYIYSEKANISTSLAAPLRFFDQGVSSTGVNSTTFINYVYSPVTTFGLGFGIGALEVENGRTQVFEQVLVRGSYVLNALLTFNGTVGCEFRDAGDQEEISPVFGLGFAWAPRLGTGVSLLAERRILNSAAVTGANFASTNFSLSVTQTLGLKFQATGTVGLEDARYDSVTTGVNTNRHDVLLILQSGLSYQITDRWVTSLTLSYGKNYSGRNGIDTFQSALSLSYVF